MIDLLPNSDQEEVAESARVLLGRTMPIDRLRQHYTGDPATTAEAWSVLTGFGWFMIGIGEEHGGLGSTAIEEMLLFREGGRFLLPPSVLATSLAAHASENTSLGSAFTNGQARAGIALETEDGCLMIDSASATHLVAIDSRQKKLELFAADQFLERKRLSAVDEHVTLEAARLQNRVPLISASDASAYRRAVLLIAATLCGGSQQCLELAVEHAKTREQFGQPIGAFQAVKHHCANMAVLSETASAQLAMAALSHVNATAEADFHVYSAALAAIRAASTNGATAIQVHGGMGFTWETHVHRFVKRAQLLVQLLGGQRRIEAAVLDSLGNA